MNFQPDINLNQNNITGIDATAIKINQVPFTSSILIAPTGDVQMIDAVSPVDLSSELWQKIIEHAPEVLLIGTGAKQQFLSPTMLAPLYQARIGVECMDSGAAARTFNVLMSEGRRVLAVIILPQTT